MSQGAKQIQRSAFAKCFNKHECMVSNTTYWCAPWKAKENRYIFMTNIHIETRAD